METLKPIYNDHLYPRNHSFEQWIDRASSLWEPDRPTRKFTDFVLSGTYLENHSNDEELAYLDITESIVPDDYSLRARRDYDSLIGVCESIMVEDNISIWAVPHPTHALRASIHVKHVLLHDDNEDEPVEFHRIPNFEFGKFGDRHHLHIFFPQLCTPERRKKKAPHQLMLREREIFYDHGLRPAMLDLLGNHMVGEWPATVETEELRAKKSKGGSVYQTRLIPQHVVGQISQTIRICLSRAHRFDGLDFEDYKWASDFFILHTLRGTKGISFHRADAQSASEYFRTFLADARLPRDILTTGRWYIDVALEIISNAGDSLQWLTSTHNRVVEQFLGIDDDDAQRITSIGSSQYARDMSSHITDLSGFRAVPGAFGEGPYECRYVQAYTTDKAVVYNIDGGHHAKFITVKQAMSSEHPLSTITGLHTIYSEARFRNPSNARLEMRVPIEFATTVLLEFDAQELKSCLAVFKTSDWWSFRSIRLTAASQLLSLQATGDPAQRIHEQALTLTAACVWLVNGIHARPDDGQSSRRIMDASLPIYEDDEHDEDLVAYRASLPRRQIAQRDDRQPGDEEEIEVDDGDVPQEEYDEYTRHRIYGLPHNPFGIVYLRRIKYSDAPRFRLRGPALNELTIYTLFGMTSEQLNIKYVKTGFVDKETLRAIRSTTNKRRLPLYANTVDEPQPDLFAVAPPDHNVPTAVVDDGSDVEDRETPPTEQSVNAFLSELWRQFILDLIAKSPNPRGSTNASYILLTDEERRHITEDAFKSYILSDIFRSVQTKYAEKKDWERAFKWLFPERGVMIPDTVQNYPTCPYFQRWLAYANNPKVTPQEVRDSRRALWRRLGTLAWIPDAHQDKLWDTSKRTGFTYFPVNAPHRPAPRVLVRRSGQVVFNDT